MFLLILLFIKLITQLFAIVEKTFKNHCMEILKQNESNYVRRCKLQDLVKLSL